jgi:hypothetical protein
LIGTWFGYVGSCVASPDATCRPFLAFLALAAAAVAALALVLMAYRAEHERAMREIEERRARKRALDMQDRPRLAPGEAELAAHRPLQGHGRWRIAA